MTSPAATPAGEYKDRLEWSCLCGKVQGHVRKTKPVIHHLCHCDNCTDAVRVILGSRKAFSDKEYVDQYGAVEYVCFYKKDVVVTEGLDLIDGFVVVEGSENVRNFSMCCHTPIASNVEAMPHIALYPHNFKSKEAKEILGKPSVRVMTRYAQAPPPDDTPSKLNYGRAFVFMVCRFICCSFCYRSKSQPNPIPPKEGMFRVAVNVRRKSTLGRRSSIGSAVSPRARGLV
mmetsp:Transcript_21669/g.43495  ORF Transcript_21669/g.43495 Transcript_21669/m.43495 type:complete len:230 (-) Transcript_21669:64-753(-)